MRKSTSIKIENEIKPIENLIAEKIKSGDINYLKSLNLYDFSRPSQNYKGVPFLIVAANFGKSDIVKFLIEKGVDLKSVGKDSLIYAIANGHKETIKTLLEKIVEKESSFSDAEFVEALGEALIKAAQYNDFDTIKILFENGANFFYEDLERKTAFDYLENKEEFFKLLTLEDLRKILITAIDIGNIGLVKFLVEEKRLDLNFADSEERTPLIALIESEHVDKVTSIEIAEILLKNGAEIDFMTSANLEKVALASAISSQKLYMVEFLIEKGAKLEFGGKFPTTALEVARFVKENNGGQDYGIKTFIKNHLLEKQLSDLLKDPQNFLHYFIEVAKGTKMVFNLALEKNKKIIVEEVEIKLPFLLKIGSNFSNFPIEKLGNLQQNSQITANIINAISSFPSDDESKSKDLAAFKKKLEEHLNNLKVPSGNFKKVEVTTSDKPDGKSKKVMDLSSNPEGKISSPKSSTFLSRIFGKQK
ncbi:MAG: ankyrin repeat domain-containing protein [Rickettsiales bacterium]|nr:ankyrin repeat domain-containing protein [Rickettsiales bacterium]